ncbi:acyltransferase family protein [Sphingomonas endophytica]|uniref:Acyltransferase 3 domain-containing protein n=1 Tax=Sphingomonas endophytica TaxID=869719 RepID=A0A147I6V4_9SPHN|nr:acyltransferase [Sphingomonas endophytica]KTT74664.1 hypothetical protein NS334_04580 [Sphingomonas endophytica]
MARTLAGTIGQTANDFHLLRTAAALAVIVSHAFPLGAGNADAEPFYRSGWTPGGCAVIVFFAMSGFLIAGSFERRPDFVHFAASRARRILPAHLLALLIVTVGFGTTVTTLAPAEYWSDPATWDFLARNAVLDTSAKTLPGVFVANPHVATVNGSLWSLPQEVLCYTFLYAAGRAGWLRRDRCAWFVLAAMAALVLLRVTGTGGRLPHVAPSFLAGIAFYTYRERVPARLTFFAALLGVAWLARDLPLHGEITRVVIAYGALTVATGSTRPGRWIAGTGDYSYGLYLYGWPVTQTIVATLPGIGVGPLIVLAVPITAVFAMASWHGIERPVLRGNGTRPNDIAGATASCAQPVVADVSSRGTSRWTSSSATRYALPAQRNTGT